MKIKIVEIVGLAFLIAGLVVTLFFSHQDTFFTLFSGITIAFSGYFVLTFCSFNGLSNGHLIGIGILIRLLALFNLPSLTDDFYRFIWDGWLNASGISPYLFTPRELIQEITPPPDLFNHLNSQDYYSIYPPLLQIFFHIAYLLSKGSIVSFIFWAKMPILIGEALTIILIPKILRALGQHEKLAKWYFFNPLIIVELMGNLHYEGLAIAGLCLGVYGVLHNKSFVSVIGVSFAVGIKLVPLIALPFFMILWNWKNRLAMLVLLTLFFKDLFDVEVLAHFFTSFNLYFQKFEFNGGVYFFSRELSKLIIGYNPIAYLGPGLQIVVVVGTVFLFYKWFSEKYRKINAGIEMIFFISLLYYFFSTTVHPWYLGIPIFLGVFLNFRFIYVWSWLIFLSYFHYVGEEYEEAFWVPVIEYGGLWILMMVEIKKRWNFES